MPEMNVIEILCDQCGDKSSKTIHWIRNNDSLRCDCGTSIVLDAVFFKTQIERVERNFDAFQQAVKGGGA